MVLQKERKVKYFIALAAGLITVLFFSLCRVEAASNLALFSFESASNMKIAKGAKINLAGDTKASSWTSSNTKIVKITKKGVATAVNTGKAVISAKINGEKQTCQITVVKDVVKGSSYIKNIYRTWKNSDTGKKVTVKSGNLKKGLDDFLSNVKPENEDDIVYKKCSKITAIDEDSAGATIYFEATGVFNGKEASYPCAAVITKNYSDKEYSYSIMFQPAIWVTDDGQLLYGAGIFWYA